MISLRQPTMDECSISGKVPGNRQPHHLLLLLLHLSSTAQVNMMDQLC
jgi:hypothetical protein